MPEQDVVLVGIDGKKYFRPDTSENTRSKLDSAAEAAFIAWNTDNSEENYIWHGRREAYRINYNKAIIIFGEGLKKFPNSYRLLRHRGHRYITIRQFDRAVEDLQRAAELMPKDSLETEPDGIPNKLNIPLSSTQFNIYYHLALAYYLKGDFREAENVYRKCMKVSVNDDLLCATADWLYMALRRQGHRSQADSLLASIGDSLRIIENDSYFKRILMYKGRISPDALLTVESGNDDPDLAIATQGYGVGNWYLCNGDTTRAIDTFRKVTAGKHFSAFGFIAAESDLVRLDDRPQ